jgi:hypothetical protein
MDDLELSNIDVHALRSLYKSNPAARLVLDSLAARQNKSNTTTVSSLHSYLTRAAYEISRKDIIETFKELQKLNCGEYVNGKTKGNTDIQSRFIWKVNLVSVGRAATDKKLRR